MLGLASGMALSLLILYLSCSTWPRRESGIRLGTTPQESNTVEETPNTAQRHLMKEDNVQFVFVIGLESTGHHLLEALVAESPAVAQVKERGLEDPAQRLQKLMHPLFDGVCEFTEEANMGLENWKFVQQLERVKKKLGGPTPQTVFFNAQHEEISYPLGTDDCRQMRFPDLDVLYAACDEVGAHCGHIYMHRDPYEVIHSTKIRELNPSVLAATRTYYAMLNVIYSQLAAYSERTLGCWGFFDGEAAEASLWDDVQKLLLWDDKAEFQDAVRRVVRGRHPPLTELEKAELIPDTIAPSMESMIKAHKRTLALCQEQAGQNSASVST